MKNIKLCVDNFFNGIKKFFDKTIELLIYIRFKISPNKKGDKNESLHNKD